MRKALLKYAMILMATLSLASLCACGDDDPTPTDPTPTDPTEDTTTTGQTNNDNDISGANGNDDNSTNSGSTNNDEGTDTSFKKLILGTWEGCVDTYDDIMCTVTFKSNGTFSEVDVYSGGTIDSDGTYTIDGDILTLDGEYSQLINANAYTFIIVECTSKHLVLTPFYARNDVQFYYDNITLTRK